MKHAGSASLDALGDLLGRLRDLRELKETRRGIFYRRSKAFLHFHEDPAGLFADVKLNGVDFERLAVTTEAERAALLKAVRRALVIDPDGDRAARADGA